MKSFNFVFLFLLYVILLFTIAIVNGVTIQYSNQSPYGDWSSSSSWVGGILPGPSDTANIITNNDYCQVTTPITTGIVNIGAASITSKLEILNTFSTKSIKLMNPSILIFNKTSSKSQVQTTTTFTSTGIINNYNQLRLTGSAVIFNDLNNFTNYLGGNVEFTNYLTIGIGAVVNNFGSSIINGTSIEGTLTINNSPSNQMPYPPNDLNYGLLVKTNGTFQLLNSILNATVWEIELHDSGEFISIDSTLNYEYPIVDDDFGWIYAESFGKLNVENSKFNLQNVAISLNELSKTNIKNSTIDMNNFILISNYAEVNITDGSVININGFFGASDDSLTYLKNSTINVLDDYFSLSEDAILEIKSSRLSIIVAETVESIIGTLDRSTLNILDGSTLYLNAVFLSVDQSSICINSSNITVELELYISDQAFIIISDHSTLLINGETAIMDLAYLHVYNSLVLVNDSLLVSYQSDFDFQDSVVIITETLTFSAQDYTSYITRTDFRVDGSFDSSGDIAIVDSHITVKHNFTSSSTMTCNGTDVQIESGDFYISGGFIGSNSNFTLKDGVFQVAKTTSFTCTGCIIDIQNGDFIQGPKSHINIKNTVFTNTKGKVETEGDIMLEESGITNNGEFILKADINADTQITVLSLSLRDSYSQSYVVDNRGSFIINGVNTSNINVKFTNTGGRLDVSQNSNVQVLEQSSGTIILSGSTLSSPEIISIQGGTLEGNGGIQGQVQNNGQLGNKENVNIINVNGTLTQTSESTMNVYITEDNNSQFKVDNGDLNLNGTLKVRIDDSISDANQTKQIITSTNIVNGSFKTIQIVYYNKETKTEYPPCKPIKTEVTEKGFAVLLESGNSPSKNSCLTSSEIEAAEEEAEEKKKNLTIPLTVGLVVGVVAIAAIVTAFILLKNRMATKLFFQKTLDKFERSIKDRSHK